MIGIIGALNAAVNPPHRPKPPPKPASTLPGEYRDQYGLIHEGIIV